ncbi:acyltransferase domain-containing protein [Sphingomonas pokkalii]|uniref:acyltransferase domain-containing protein n=1 Tax=Sphingomonas pokkalii TaxID=2175090 RepID=UPI001057E7DA|nr:acyltransferase domain-containing protein [Sphingomonas pokkalii]
MPDSDALPPLLFMLPGSGVEVPGMGRSLLADRSFADSIAQCDEAARPSFAQPLRAFLDGTAEDGEPGYRSAALAAFCIASAAALNDRGVRADGWLGCSIGEIAALAIAGAMSLEDAFAFIAAQARAIAQVAPRGTLLFALGEPALEDAARYWTDAHLAGVYAPGLLLFAATDADIDRVMARAQAEGAVAQRVPVPTPVHSPLIDPAQTLVAAAAEAVRWQGPGVLLSAAAGGKIAAADAGHLWRVVRAAIRFDRAIQAAAPGTIAIDIGPSGALTSAARRATNGRVRALAIGGARGPDAAGLDRIAGQCRHPA